MSYITGTQKNDTITPDLLTGGISGSPTPFPSDEDDEIHGYLGNDYIVAGGGTDFIFGDDTDDQKGNDTLDGGSGADYLYGHAGNDTYVIDNAGDQIIESVAASGGIDTVRSSVLSVSLAAFGGDSSGLENITLTGSRSLNAIGNNFANVLTGNGAANQLAGNGGNDQLLGGSGNDTLDGGSGNDKLAGQAGSDLLVGNLGADTLIGGAGQDVFRFRSASHSAPGAVDQLVAGDGGKAFDGAGSAAGDILDLSGIDANTTKGGDQAFVLGGSGAGHLTLSNSGTDTILRGNTDKDAAFEFQLVIHDGSGVSASHYTAADFLL